MRSEESVWVISSLTESFEYGALTIGSTFLAAAPTRSAAEEILHLHAPYISTDVVEYRIDEVPLVSL